MPKDMTLNTNERLKMSNSKCPVHGIPDCSPLLNGCSWSPSKKPLYVVYGVLTDYFSDYYPDDEARLHVAGEILKSLGVGHDCDYGDNCFLWNLELEVQ